MGLPKSIEERGARADEFMQKSGTPQQAAPAQKQPQQQEPAQTPPASQANPTPAFEAGWEQKYKVLQGKYNAEVPALNERVRVAEANLQAVQSEIAQLKARPAAPDLSQISAEEREQYGDDFVNFVAKVAANQAPARNDDGLAQRVEQLANTVAETKEQEFFRLLDAQAQGWEALNTDAGFLAWLSEVDEFSGLSRQQMFNDAYQRLNVERVAKFFNAYSKSNQSTEGAANLPPLNQQVVPNVNRAPEPPAQGKKQWTARGIAEFYTAMRQGLYKDRVQEAALIEQDIFAAQSEGRVR